MDVQAVFQRLTAGAGGPMIKTGWVYRHALSPITLWCERYAPQDQKDPIDPFTQQLFEQGQTHEAAVVAQSFPGGVREYFATEEEGFRRALELMAGGASSIVNMPLIDGPMGLEGRPDVLERIDGVPSELGDYSYRVVEIKLARRIKQGHILQAASYNRLLGLAQGYEPEEFDIINGDSLMITYPMSEWDDKLDAALEDIREILNGRTVDPCYGAGEWPWKSYVNQLAIDVDDVSLLSGVGETVRRNLIGAGYCTVKQIALATEVELTAVDRVGAPTARKLVAFAQALVSDKVIQRGPTPEIPRGRTEVFFDLEGTGPQLASEGLEVTNYLIGNICRPADGNPVFVPFFTPSSDGEEANLRAFLNWASSLDDPVFYHWHHYEKTHLEKMGEFYAIDPAQLACVMDRMVNLDPPVTGSFAFPCYGRTLKDIAKVLGFKWRQDDVDGAGSMVLFRKFVESGGTDLETKEKILIYNEDDCVATMHVFDWLVAQEE